MKLILFAAFWLCIANAAVFGDNAEESVGEQVVVKAVGEEIAFVNIEAGLLAHLKANKVEVRDDFDKYCEYWDVAKFIAELTGHDYFEIDGESKYCILNACMCFII